MHSALLSLHTLPTSLPSHRRGNNGFPLGRVMHESTSSRRPAVIAVKAMAAQGSDSLDHLQRATKIRQQQLQQPSQQPRRRVSQSDPIGLWDRFPTARTVHQMMDTMDRIIEDPYAYRGSPFPSLSGDEGVVGGGYRRGRTPWEIKEGEGAYKMRFDIPGMTKKDVKLCVEDRVLVVKAEKTVSLSSEEAEAPEEWSAKSYGRYNSRIELPDNVEVEKIKAEVKDGVLYITIPKVSSTSKVLGIDVQ